MAADPLDGLSVKKQTLREKQSGSLSQVDGSRILCGEDDAITLLKPKPAPL